MERSKSGIANEVIAYPLNREHRFSRSRFTFLLQFSKKPILALTPKLLVRQFIQLLISQFPGQDVKR